MKYYQRIDFIPSLKVDEDSSPEEKREAWLEEVACAVLNHTKEDCCLRVRQVLELLVEVNRADLLPGKKERYYPIDQLVGGASIKMRNATDSFTKIGQIAVAQCHATIPKAGNDDVPFSPSDSRKVDLYYFLVNPDTLRDLYKKGTLPRS